MENVQLKHFNEVDELDLLVELTDEELDLVGGGTGAWGKQIADNGS